jgi:Zn-dependent protease
MVPRIMGGAIRLFKIWGIEVYLHFSWFLIAVYQLTSRPHGYAKSVFAIYEYLALFGIVLMHEFGHALACRQTGGEANRIMLWPLGGVAFVRPPARPGAELWSIAAGPLVNVILVPLLILAQIVGSVLGWPLRAPDAFRLLEMVALINFSLLVFNLLPIYPLDGGQILRSLLWFVCGRIRSLQIASLLGFITIPLAAFLGIYYGWEPIWMVILAFFLLSQAMRGWRHAQALTLAAAEAKQMAEVAMPPPAP